MSNGASIGAALLGCFVLFLAARNRLTVYENVLWGAPSSSGNSQAGNESAGGIDAKDVAGTAANLIGGPVAIGFNVLDALDII